MKRVTASSMSGRIARLLGIPPGTGELLSGSVRWRFAASAVFSFGLAFLDVLGVLATVPLMQYIADPSATGGVVGWLRSTLHLPDNASLLSVLAGFVIGCFLIKDVTSIFVRRWQLRFMADQEVALATRLFEGYLVGPYRWHLKRNTSDKLWAIGTAIGTGFTSGIGGALNIVTELLTIALIGGSLIVVSPGIGLGAIVYVGAA
jgi:hypothetical protein